jgi:hypothetical protein
VVAASAPASASTLFWVGAFAASCHGWAAPDAGRLRAYGARTPKRARDAGEIERAFAAFGNALATASVATQHG